MAPTCVILSEKKQRVTIKPCGDAAKFEDGTEYTVSILPTEHSEVTYILDSNVSESWDRYDKITVKPQNGVISFEYIFEDEQQWAIDVYRDGDTKQLKRFFVYSVFEDLYERHPYMGDLHAHSCRSDGAEEPAVVAANYRREGFDFMGLTDHSKWRPSQGDKGTVLLSPLSPQTNYSSYCSLGMRTNKAHLAGVLYPANIL